MDIQISVEPVELIDQLAVMRLRADVADNPKMRAALVQKVSDLYLVAEPIMDNRDELVHLSDKLYQCYADLRMIEKDMRNFEARSDFGPAFIALARAHLAALDDCARTKDQLGIALQGLNAAFG